MPFTTIVTAHDDAAGDALAAVLAAPTSARVVAVDADLPGALALRRVVAAESAELLVLGTRHPDTGDASPLWTLHGAPCAVAIAPPDAPAPTTLSRIGVGVDNGAEAGVAVALAHDLARRTGAALHLFAVVDDGVPAWITSRASGPRVAEGLVQRRLAVALELLSGVMEDLDEVELHGKLLVGNPAFQLARAATGVDLLVLGSRHSGPARRLALGTTSERLLRETPVALLLVPRGDDTGGAAQRLPVRTLHALA